MNDITIVLSPKDALVADISTPPEEQHFDAEPDIEAGNVELRIGRGPLTVDLTEQTRSTGKELAPELKYLESRFRVLLLSTSLSILRVPGTRVVSQLQYSLDFDRRAEVVIIDLLPRPEIVEAAKVTLGTRTEVHAEVDAKGQIGVVFPHGGAAASAGADTGNRAGVVANFDYTIYAVRTQAIGQYGKTAIWNFSNDGKPLIGDFVFATTLLVDKLLDTRLHFKVSASASLSRLGLFPEKRSSEWIPQEIDLKTMSIGSH
jgi:hypothetical protein